jgi:hypothetical protein
MKKLISRNLVNQVCCFDRPCQKYKNANAAINITGKMIIVFKVFCPAASSRASPVNPDAAAVFFALSIHPPMIG